MDLFIRPAGPADAEEIADVQRRSWHAAYTGLLPPESLERVERTWDARHWRTSLERTDDWVVSLVLDGKETGVAGFCVGGPRRGARDQLIREFAGEIYLLYLLPVVQRRGHGRRMMGAMARVLLARRMESAVVWALTTNRAALDFYLRLDGSILAQCRKPFFGETVSETAIGWSDLHVLARASRNLRQ